MNKIKKKKDIPIILLLILVIGLFLRSYKLVDGMIWASDASRDITAAKHIAIYYEGLNETPWSSGGAILGNTPFYYWILALIWLITKSEIGVLIFFVIVGLITIFLGYLAGKEIGGQKYGLITAGLIAFNPTFVEISRQVWQPHLTPAFTLVATLLMLKAVNHKGKFLYGASSSSFIGASIHLSLIPLFFVLV